jgi:hypothetical protein
MIFIAGEKTGLAPNLPLFVMHFSLALRPQTKDT